MLQWFLRFSEFPEFTEFNESSAPFRENSIVYFYFNNYVFRFILGKYFTIKIYLC